MILIIGYGNPIRGDDGVGHYIADILKGKNIPGAEIITAHQLHVELLETAVLFDKVILVDASQTSRDVGFGRIQASFDPFLNSSHHLTPGMFVRLAQTIYFKDIEVYLCSVRGENFDMGSTLSPRVMSRSKKAVKLICSFLQGALQYA